MAKTAAERQREYRAKRPFAGERGDGEKRVAAYVSTRAALALRRLANHSGVTQREILEKLLIAEEDKVIEAWSLDSPEGRKYLGD